MAPSALTSRVSRGCNPPSLSRSRYLGPAVAFGLFLALSLLLATPATAAIAQDARFFFPQECFNRTDRTCCPSYLGSACGVALARGDCLLAVNASLEGNVCNAAGDELALTWFTDFFDHACVCRGNFWGARCDSCMSGWTGDDCETPMPLLVRRDFATLSGTEQQRVVQGFRLLQTTPHQYWPEVSVWQWLTSMHVWVNKPLDQHGVVMRGVNLAHAGPSLTHWHRIFMYHVDKHFRLVLNDTSFTMPYWNWTRANAGDKVLDPAVRLTGGDGDADAFGCHEFNAARFLAGGIVCNCTVTSGPFTDFTQITYWGETLFDQDSGAALPIQRALGCINNRTRLPSVERVRRMMAIEDYEEWARDFSVVHAGVHLFVGWTMSRGSPPSDPLFFMHHAMVDLLFDQWIRNSSEHGRLSAHTITPISAVTGHARDQCASGYYPLVRNSRWFAPSYVLGYTYDYLVSEDPEHTSRFHMPLLPTDPIARQQVVQQLQLDAAAVDVETAAALDARVATTGAITTSGSAHHHRHRPAARVAATPARRHQQAEVEAETPERKQKEEIQEEKEKVAGEGSVGLVSNAASVGANSRSTSSRSNAGAHRRKHRLARSAMFAHTL